MTGNDVAVTGGVYSLGMVDGLSTRGRLNAVPGNMEKAMTLEEIKNLLEFTRQQNHKILETLDAHKDPVMYGFRLGEETMLDYALELLEKVEQND